MDPTDPFNEKPPRKTPFLARLFWQFVAALLILFLTDLIHYRVHPLNSVTTAGSAFLISLSFLPGIILGRLIIWIQERMGDDDPEVPVAAVICALLWFVYLFRALTLLVGLPFLSDWMQGPAEFLVRCLEWMDPDKLARWFLG